MKFWIIGNFFLQFLPSETYDTNEYLYMFILKVISKVIQKKKKNENNRKKDAN